MGRKNVVRTAILSTLASVALPSVGVSQEGPVRMVLFFSPTCPHCEQVMTQDLPTFFEVYGGRPQVFGNRDAPRSEQFAFLVTNGRLEILMVDASRPRGGVLYQTSLESYPTEPGRRGVPRLIVDDDVLVGSMEIPGRLHGIIQAGLASGGTTWPTVAGLEEVLTALRPAPVVAEDAGTAEPRADPNDATADTGAAPSSAGPREIRASGPRQPAEAAPAEQAADSPMTAIPFEQIVQRPVSVRQRFLQDPVGNGLSVFVLLIMIASVAAVPKLAETGASARMPDVAIPIAAALGIGVAAYLTYIEVSGATAVCGPVGDCNAVNQSEYAVLFGILPVGTLGLAGYAGILFGWGVARWSEGSAADVARVALLAMAFVGTVFSIYLTFLEPFVIGATCAWCLTSAVLITLLLWLSARPGVAAWARLRTAAPAA
ncbi:MAG: vitamin K epoxide reductase family protein [Gemmatimonadota bacterium]|nr:MAG: vitamin K epoxide reductase family protein [Gemmatimonadota bacterium]